METTPPPDLRVPVVPVVILGGGPVGLSLAVELRLHGVACTVVEPRRTVSTVRPRAKTTSARTMELFRRWGLAERVRARAPIPVAWSSDVVFCASGVGPEITRFTGTLGLTLAGDDLVSEPGQQVGQPVVEQVLRDALAADPGATVLLGSRGVGVEQDADGVVVHVRDEDGEVSTLRADYAIGADGARSVVRTAMGVGYEGGDAGRPNLSVVFRSRELGSLLSGRALHRWVLDPTCPGVIGPLDLGEVWWAVATGRPADDSGVDPVALVRGLVGAEVDVEVLGTDPWQARSLLATSYRERRLFLAGDAAHQNPPWGGHGFNTGVGDAANLGWKLAAVLSGQAPEALLDTYDAERRPVAARTIAITAENTKVLPTELASPGLVATGEELKTARAAAAEAVQRTKHVEFHCLGLVLGYGYGEGAAEQTTDGTDYRPVAAAGNRLPHRWLSPGGSLYDHLGDGFAVLGATGDVAPLLAAAAERGLPLRAVEPDLVDTSWFGAEVVLVRPDQHVAWLGDRPAPERAAALLDQVLARGLVEGPRALLPT